MVLGYAVEHSGNTGSADTLFAGQGNFDTVCREHLGNGALGGDKVGVPGAGDANGKRSSRRGIGYQRLKILSVQGRYGPAVALGSFEDCFDKARRATDI